LDALIFDFDGVIVDSEPIHLDCFQRILAQEGIRLSREDYYTKYVGFDDHDCFAAALRDAGQRPAEPLIARMTRDKTRLVQEAYARGVSALPGAVELVRSAAEANVLLAICSGALPEEIEAAARSVGVWGLFGVIVTPRDVTRGKPDPEGYRRALERLVAAAARPLRAGACVVVEDAAAGIEAARGAGMKVLAVTNSYPAEALCRADRVVASLSEITLRDLEKIAG
jgi:beta-phosphoglucomutase